MKSKKYSFFSMLFIILVALYVYSFEGASYSIELFGVLVELPVAIWVVVPLIIFFGLSLFHMVFYGLGSYMIIKKYDNDYKNLISLFKSKVLKQKNKFFDFKTTDYKNIGEFVTHLDISLIDTGFKSKDLGLDDVLSSFKRIENGEYVRDLDLDVENPLYLKNIENRFNKESKFAIEVLKNAPAYTKKVIKMAYERVINSLDKKDIFKYMEQVEFGVNEAFLILEKYKNTDIELSVEEIKEIISKAGFDRDDFLKLVNMLKGDFEPENLIATFEALSNRFEKAEEAYIYVLLDLELIDRAKDILELSNENEFLKLKAYITLKESGEHYNVDLFI